TAEPGAASAGTTESGDLAHADAAVTLLVENAQGGRRLGFRHHDHHADAQVEDLPHLLVGYAPRPLHLGEDPRLLPGVAIDLGADLVGKDPLQVRLEPAPGDVDHRMH